MFHKNNESSNNDLYHLKLCGSGVAWKEGHVSLFSDFSIITLKSFLFLLWKRLVNFSKSHYIKVKGFILWLPRAKMQIEHRGTKENPLL